MINYTVKYGSQEYTWVEHNCQSLHKSKQLRIDYRLGQIDQTVSSESYALVEILPHSIILGLISFIRIHLTCTFLDISDHGGQDNEGSRDALRYLQKRDSSVTFSHNYLLTVHEHGEQSLR